MNEEEALKLYQQGWDESERNLLEVLSFIPEDIVHFVIISLLSKRKNES
jgi:hypothetical protein